MLARPQGGLLDGSWSISLPSRTPYRAVNATRRLIVPSTAPEERINPVWSVEPYEVPKHASGRRNIGGVEALNRGG